MTATAARESAAPSETSRGGAAAKSPTVKETPTALPTRSSPVATRRGLDLLTGLAGPVRKEVVAPPPSRVPSTVPGAMMPAKFKSDAFKEIERMYWQESNSQERDFDLLESLKEQMTEQLEFDKVIEDAKTQLDKAEAAHEWKKAAELKKQLSLLPKSKKEAEKIAKRKRVEAEEKAAREQERARIAKEESEKTSRLEAERARREAERTRRAEAEARRHARKKEEEAQRKLQRKQQLEQRKQQVEAERKRQLEEEAERLSNERTAMRARKAREADEQARRYRDRKLQEERQRQEEELLAAENALKQKADAAATAVKAQDVEGAGSTAELDTEAAAVAEGGAQEEEKIVSASATASVTPVIDAAKMKKQLSIEATIQSEGGGDVDEAILALEMKLDATRQRLKEAKGAEDFLAAHSIKERDIPSIEATITAAQEYKTELEEKARLAAIAKRKREERAAEERRLREEQEKLRLEQERLAREAEIIRERKEEERAIVDAERNAREAALKQLHGSGNLGEDEIAEAKRSPEQTVVVLEARIGVLREKLKAAVAAEDFLEAASIKGSTVAVTEVLKNVRAAAKAQAEKRSRVGALRKAEELLKDQKEKKASMLQETLQIANSVAEERRNSFDKERERLEAELAAERAKRADMEAKAQKLAEEARQREAVVKAKALAAEEARRKAQEEKARVQRMEIEAREKHQAAVALQSVHRRNVAKATAARKRNVAPIPPEFSSSLTGSDEEHRAAVRLQASQRRRQASAASQRLRIEKQVRTKELEEYEARRLAAVRMREAEEAAEKERLKIERDARLELEKKEAEQEAERARLRAMLEEEQKAREAVEATVTKATAEEVGSFEVVDEDHDESKAESKTIYLIHLSDEEKARAGRVDYTISFDTLPLPFQVVQSAFEGSSPLVSRAASSDAADEYEILPLEKDTMVDVAGVILATYSDPIIKAKQTLAKLWVSPEKPLVIGFRSTNPQRMSKRIQSSYRGYAWRRLSMAGEEVMHALQIRAFQRRQNVCATVIQRLFQTSLVRRRYRQILGKTEALQSFARSFVWRNMFMNKVRANRVLVPFIRRWLKINRVTSSVLRVMLDAEKSRIKEQGKKALTDGNALGENEEEKSGNTDRPKFALCAVDAVIDVQDIYPSGWGRALNDLDKLLRAEDGEQPSHRIIAIDCGSTHTLALTSGGEMYSWGWDDFGQLGHQEFEQFAEPTLVEMTVQRPPDTGEGVQGVPGALDVGSKAFIRKIACGNEHSLALSFTGQVYAWGRNNRGQLGIGFEAQMTRPELVKSLSHLEVSDIACGSQHSGAICELGVLYSWGEGAVVGHGVFTGTGDIHEPTKLPALRKTVCRQIECGPQHTLILADSSVEANCGFAIFAFGMNDNGQLGLNDTNRRLVPTAIAHPDGMDTLEHWVSVGCGGKHSVALTNQGRVWCWGWNRFGQIGVGDTINRLRPSRLQISLRRFCQKRFIQVLPGLRHTAALTRDGKIMTWGRGAIEDSQDSGIRSNGDMSAYPQAIPMTALGESEKPTQLCCAFSQSISITAARCKSKEGPSTAGKATKKGASGTSGILGELRKKVGEQYDEVLLSHTRLLRSRQEVESPPSAKTTPKAERPTNVLMQHQEKEVEYYETMEEKMHAKSRDLRRRGAIADGAMLRYFRPSNLVAAANRKLTIRGVLERYGRHDYAEVFGENGVSEYIKMIRRREQAFIISPVVRMFHKSLGDDLASYQEYMDGLMARAPRTARPPTEGKTWDSFDSPKEADTAGLRDLDLRLAALSAECNRLAAAETFVGGVTVKAVTQAIRL